MRISSKEEELLSALEIDAKRSASSLSRHTGMQERSVRYSLGRLSEKGMYNPRPLINPFIFGYADYVILFSMTSVKGSKLRVELLEALQLRPEVSWVGELGGRFHYGISILAAAPSEAVQFFDEMHAGFGSVVQKRELSIRHASNIYGRKFLGSKTSKSKLRYTDTGIRPRIDDIDRKILIYVSKQFDLNDSLMSRELGLAHSTFIRKLARLEDEGVIVGYFNAVDAIKLAQEQYKLLAIFKGVDANLREQVRRFCENHSRVTHLIECLGSWDFEIGIEVSSGKDCIEITAEINQEFSESIVDLEVIPEFTCLKFVNCPWS